MTESDQTDAQKQFIQSFKDAFKINNSHSIIVKNQSGVETLFKSIENIESYLLTHFHGKQHILIQPCIQNHTYFCSIKVDGKDALQRVQELYEVCDVQNVKCYPIATAENDFSVIIFFSEAIPIHMVLRFKANLLREAQIIGDEDDIGSKKSFCLLEHQFELPFYGGDWANNNGIFLDPDTGFKAPYQDQTALLKTVIKVSLGDVGRVINDLNTSPTPPRGDDLKRDFIQFNLCYFLNSILAQDGLVEITPDLKNSAFFPVNPIDPICDYIRNLNKAGKDCFFGVASRTVDIGRRSSLTNISTIKTFFVDIDPSDKSKSAEEQLKDSTEQLHQFLSNLAKYGIPLPSFIIKSGHGYHVYFILTEIILVPSSEWQVIQNSLIEFAGADKSAKDVTRVLRMPFSQNNKDPNNPQQVTIMLNTGNTFSFKDFEPFIKEHSPRQKSPDIQLDDNTINTLPPCLDKLFDPQTPIPSGHRHDVRFVCAVYAHKQSWPVADTIQKLLHTTSNQQKCETDVKGVYKILDVDKNRYRSGCGEGSIINSLVDDGITICDKENCPYNAKQYGRIFINPIKKMGNKYCKEKKIDKKTTIYEPISTFKIEPIESIICNAKEHIKGHLISECDKTVTLVFPPETWISKQRLLSILPGKEFIFWGTELDVQFIHHLMSKDEFPSKQGFKAIGLHFVNGVWTYLTNTGGITMNGKISDAVYISDVTEFNTDILETNPMISENVMAFLNSFAYFNALHVVAPILGFSVACFFKPRLFKIKNSFPILFLSGERGSAKTVTVRAILLALHGNRNAEKMLSQMTSFTIMKLVDASNSLPLFLDEFKPSIMKDEMKRIISELIRTSYNGLKGDRGQADQSKIEYHYSTPIVIAGEDQFTEPAVMERIIAVAPSKQASLKYQQYFEYLTNNFDLTSFGRLIIETAVAMTDEEVISIYHHEYQQISPAFTGRLRDNVAIVRFGLNILNKIIFKMTGQSFPIIPFYAEESQRINLIEEHESQRSVVDNTVEALIAQIYASESNDNLNNNYKLVAETHYLVKGNELRINLSSAYPIFRKWAKDYQFEGEILVKQAFLKQIKNQAYFVAYKKAQLIPRKPGGPLCLILGMNELRVNGIETYDIVEGSYIVKQQQKNSNQQQM